MYGVWSAGSDLKDGVQRELDGRQGYRKRQAHIEHDDKNSQSADDRRHDVFSIRSKKMRIDERCEESDELPHELEGGRPR